MMHTIRVSLAGPLAKALLSSGGTGTVLSSHRAGFYSRFKGGPILMVHDEAQGLIPFGLGCPPAAGTDGWKSVRPGTPVVFDTDALAVGGYRFDVRTAAEPVATFIWTSAPPRPMALGKGLLLAMDAIRGNPAAGAARWFDPLCLDAPLGDGHGDSSPVRNVPVQSVTRAFGKNAERKAAPRCQSADPGPLPPCPENQALRRAVRDVLLWCREVSAQDADQAAMGLIGLGPGLTPLGDDILCGLLAGAHLFRAPMPGPWLDRLAGPLAEAATRRLAGRTTPHGAALVTAAAQGHSFGILDALATALALADPPDVRRAVDACLGVGATTGGGLLLGMLLSARLALHQPPYPLTG